MSSTKRVMKCNDDRIVFAIVNELGGIHYWRKHTDPMMCGIESHTPSNSGDECWLLGQGCEHDGSTTCAREMFNPAFDDCNETGDFEDLWRRLERFHSQRFEAT